MKLSATSTKTLKWLAVRNEKHWSNQENEHYVIITKRDKKYFYIFDPYYLDKDYYKKDKDIKIVLNKPFTYNRKVTINRVFSTKDDFSMGDVDKRECVLINRR